MKKLIRRLLVLAALAVAAIVGLIAWSMTDTYRGFEGDTFVTLQRGSGTAGIARTLAEAGVIRYPWMFLVMRALRPSASLQAGEYKFSGTTAVRDVFDRIARGEVYFFELTVPEGSNMFDIAHLLETADVMPASDFLKAAADPSLIRDLDPAAPGLEGYLFPSTYRLSHGATAHDLCKQMTDRFRKQWKKLVATNQAADIHRTVTLASLVEKETGVPAERPLVAGVFANRLAKGIHLDCDPTTIYAALLQNHYSGAIHRSDLASEHPYNTYQNAGLPPGPIANPGAESLAAALAPAETNYLYFVAKASGGGHQFSTNLAEHEKAVKEYRHGIKSRATKAQRKAG